MDTLSIREAADRLGLTYEGVRSRIRRNKIKSITRDGQTLVILGEEERSREEMDDRFLTDEPVTGRSTGRSGGQDDRDGEKPRPTKQDYQYLIDTVDRQRKEIERQRREIERMANDKRSWEAVAGRLLDQLEAARVTENNLVAQNGIYQQRLLLIEGSPRPDPERFLREEPPPFVEYEPPKEARPFIHKEDFRA